MVNFTILAGGYTAYIVAYLFNTNDNTLTYLDQYTTGGNSSRIISCPTNKSILYAVNYNVLDGPVQSFTVDPGGSRPPYCSALSTGQVAVVNYNSGTACVVPTEGNYLHFSSDSDIWTFPVSTTGTEGRAEPHMFYEYGSEIFIPDKGNNKIWRLGEVDGNPGNYVVHGEIQRPIGSGPRHIRIRGQVAVVNYKSGTARVVPTEGNYLHFSSDSDIWTFPVPTTGTEGHAEPHMSYEYGSEIFIPDKGNDKIWRLGEVDGNPGNYVVHGEIQQQPIGSGPRHIRIRDNMLSPVRELLARSIE
ncbi:hypothetical protein JVT61DRAFT_11007 [Boletus reticuloceps]|uniref:Uncharacterized protein n=1 Tax=Boletus reticuloceps TaxID=495285 RepID=A0A8I2YF65_9AGAM|nr:hypothetical protein JVT61DRAFT_11007 [Boletus reticuloceps]